MEISKSYIDFMKAEFSNLNIPKSEMDKFESKLQIQKIKKKYKLKDRYSREKSIEMFNIWREFYHPNGNFEVISRTWNGGPKGYLKKATVGYWMEVQNELSLINEKGN